MKYVTNLCTLSKYIICIWSWTCIHTDISNALIHHHVDHSNLLPLLSVTVGTWLPPSAIHSLISLILVYTHCNSMVIVNLYYCEKELYQLGDSVYAVSFAFHLKNSFPRLLRSEPFPPTPSIRLFHTFVIVRLLCHIVHSMKGCPNSLHEILKFAYIKIHSLCCKGLWVLTNAYCHISTSTVSFRIVSLP